MFTADFIILPVGHIPFILVVRFLVDEFLRLLSSRAFPLLWKVACVDFFVFVHKSVAEIFVPYIIRFLYCFFVALTETCGSELNNIC